MNKELLIKLAVIFCLFAISEAVTTLFSHSSNDLNSLTAYATGQGKPLWFSLYTATFLVTLVTLIISKVTEIIFFFSVNKRFLLLLAYILASCVWALDPWLSFITASRIIIASSFGFFLASRYSSKEILSLLSIAMGIIVISSFIIAIFFPEYGIHAGDDEQGAWRGAFTHKNWLSIFINIAFLIFLLGAIHFKKFRKLYIIFAVLAASLIVLSQSGTGMIILFLIGLSPFIVPFLRMHGPLASAVVLTLLGLYGVIYVLNDGLPLTEMILIALNKDPTLTGRTETWQGILYAFTDYRSSHMLFGYGAQNWFMTMSGQIITEWVIGAITPDNVYMGILLKYGLIGVVIFLLVLYKGLKIAINQAKAGVSVMNNFYIIIMLMFFVNGISEEVDNAFLLWTLFALILASPYIRDNQRFDPQQVHA